MPVALEHPADDPGDRALMAFIRYGCGSLIHSATDPTGIPEAFLAALVANESAGYPDATRLESHTFARFVRVEKGLLDEWQGVRAADLKGKTWDDLIDISTSWGLTQIMGWHVLRVEGRKPKDLLDPLFNLGYAVQMLADMIAAHSLRPDTDAGAEALFRCWNAGSPTGKTSDPEYAAKGLRRMQIYEEIARSPAPPRDDSGAVVTDPEICE